MPFADEGGVVAGFFELVREGGDGGIEVSPGVLGIGADDTGDADAVRVFSGQESGAGGGADGAVGPHAGEKHAFGGEAVDVRCPAVRLVVGGDITVTVVIGEDDEEIGFLRGVGEQGKEEGGDQMFHTKGSYRKRALCPLPGIFREEVVPGSGVRGERGSAGRHASGDDQLQGHAADFHDGVAGDFQGGKDEIATTGGKFGRSQIQGLEDLHL